MIRQYVTEEEAQLLTRLRALQPASSNPEYIEFSNVEVAGFSVIDTQGNPGFEAIWAGPAGSKEGRWLLPDAARELAEALIRAADAQDAREVEGR